MNALSRLSVLVIVGALLLTGCAGDAAGPDQPDMMPVAFQTLASSEALAQGEYGSYDFETRENLVIRSQADFEAFWRVLHNHDPSPPAPPAVDFSERVVIAAMMGVKRHGGFAIEVTDVTDGPEGLHVRVVETSPDGDECAVTTALTSPYHVIAVEAAPDAHFAFESVERTRDCG